MADVSGAKRFLPEAARLPGGAPVRAEFPQRGEKR
jgi:hypothetical protein